MKFNLLHFLILTAFLVFIFFAAARLIAWKQGNLLKPESVFKPKVEEAKHRGEDTQVLVPSVLTYLDEEWSQYTNFKYGFSVNVPRQVYYLYGGCVWTTDGGDHSYRPKSSQTPLKFFEENNFIYLTTDYYFKLGGVNSESVGDKFVNYYSSCTKTPMSLVDVRKNDLPLIDWKISINNARSDEELNNFIKEFFGEFCRAGGKMLSQNAGTYDIKILEDDNCKINLKYEIKYSSELGKAAIWKKDQTYTFWKDDAKSYDDEISKSFKFVNN